jgi:hypothetical protein
MKPGITVLVRRSTTRAPGTSAKPLRTSRILRPCTMIEALRLGARPGTSISVPAWMTVTGWAGRLGDGGGGE